MKVTGELQRADRHVSLSSTWQLELPTRMAAEPRKFDASARATMGLRPSNSRREEPGRRRPGAAPEPVDPLRQHAPEAVGRV